MESLLFLEFLQHSDRGKIYSIYSILMTKSSRSGFVWRRVGLP